MIIRIKKGIVKISPSKSFSEGDILGNEILDAKEQERLVNSGIAEFIKPTKSQTEDIVKTINPSVDAVSSKQSEINDAADISDNVETNTQSPDEIRIGFNPDEYIQDGKKGRKK